MKKNLFRLLAALALTAAFATACSQREESPVSAEGRTVLTVSLSGAASRITMGPASGGTHALHWSNGDCLSLNGAVSNPLSGIGADQSTADFSFAGTPALPYNLLYPAAIYKNGTTVTLPETQSYVAGGFASGAYPLSGYASEASGEIVLHPLCALIRISVTKDAGVSASKLTKVSFRGNAGEQVCGDFEIDYPGATLTAAGDTDSGRTLSLNLSQTLGSDPIELYLVVPAGTYPSGFTAVLEDDAHRTMTKIRHASTTLSAGHITPMAAFSFVPSGQATEFILSDIIEEDFDMGNHNVTGRVVNLSGDPIPNVVVSDGLQCIRTGEDGTFKLTSNLDKTKYVFISTPSGYFPPVEAGIPKFYKTLSEITPNGGIYDVGDFVLTPLSVTNKCTVFISADPQPRSTTATLDNVAYRSTRACEALYRELAETAATITDRPVFGVCLGDLVHGSSTTNLNLMDTYATALGSLGYPTYNVIGNHDNDTAATDDDSGAWKFEQHFGPRNYSFNVCGIHFVVLDNLIMKLDSGKLTAYDQGLTDDIWTWLQADMAFIPTSTTVMVCAHSPMFKLENGSERTNSAYHGGTRSSVDGEYGYGDLFDTYNEVHAWAGHTHSTFNYIYPSSHRHKKVQVHTLARSTGDLWTNEYLSNGTPQGFTIVEIKNGRISSWRFHPTRYLLSNFHGTKGEPEYVWRDWDYVSKVATMRDTGKELDESYQMHVYPPGSYGDNYVYANIFLWDSKWDLPIFSLSGGSSKTMTQVESYDSSGTANPDCHDLADTEQKTFYKTNYGSTLGSSYDASYAGLHTLFRVAVTAEHGTGTVSVTDRFGNDYSRTISW